VGPDRLFTIGHSTRSFEQFRRLLEREGVTHLLDVRAFPASRRYPHFNGPDLATALLVSGIRYSHVAELGGRRKGRKDSHNSLWRNASFRAYADYMEMPRFASALDDVLDLARTATTAIMCAEAVPWRCHRSLISDAAIARGASVWHILDSRTEEHKLTSFARIDGNIVRYDVAEQSDLFHQASS
jgi:uncharacterized protein (DUF488 family)